MIQITVENITFQYNPAVTALREVSLTIEPGETVAIIGENGAGKSTLAKHLNGLLRPNQGRVRIGDWDTADYPTARIAARVGLAFQNPDEQLFRRTVASEVAFGPENLGFTEEAREAAVSTALAMVGLSAEKERHPHDLHSSKRRLVALAAILAMRTPVVIIDEPTIGQDARGAALIAGIIRVLNAENRTVIAISHHIEFCAANFQRIILMSRGQILADGPPEKILNRVEALETARVEPPQLIRLSRALGVNDPALTLPAFWQKIRGD